MTTETPGYFRLSISGYELYSPVDFTNTVTPEQFDRDVAECVRIVAGEVIAKHPDWFVGGHDIQDGIVARLCRRGYVVIKPHEADLEGECYYTDDPEDDDSRPKCIPLDVWTRLVEHNRHIDEKPQGNP